MLSEASTSVSNDLLALGNFSVNSIAAFTGTSGTTLAPGDAAIVFNNSGAFFNSGFTVDQGKLLGGTAQAQAFIVLHELGHALSAKGFLPDGPSAANAKAAGDQNDQLIDDHCQKTLSNFQ